MTNEIPGPIWKDCCGHGGYIGSFQAVYSFNKKLVEENCDLYIWENPNDKFQRFQVCIRHGADGSQYYSPGSVENIVVSKLHEPYASAYAMMLEKGYFAWHPKENQ
jgi:hypothetical protein